MFGLDFSKAGLKEGFVKTIKVLGWVAASAVITEGIALAANWRPTATEWIITQGVINSVLAGLRDWLTAHKPQE